MFSGIRAGIGGGVVSAIEAVVLPAASKSNKAPDMIPRRVFMILSPEVVR
jgi:hypothetical protein